jgi:type I restriction enzyme S subunit
MTLPIKSKAPKIRFKGFKGEWELAPISNFILSLDAGVSVNSGDRPANKSEFGVLKTSAVTNGVFEPHENKVVLETEEQSRLKEPVCGGTIIISRMNTPALVGANAYVESSRANLFLPDRLWAAKPRESVSMRFLAFILGSDNGRAALSKLAKGSSGSMKNITKPEVLALSVTAPTPAEQTQIGGYFREVDRLIGLQQRKHDKLVTLKKAMLHAMFPQRGETTPEIRFKGFSGDWLSKRIQDLFQVTRGDVLSSNKTSHKKTKEKPYPVYSSQTKNNGLMGYYGSYLFEDAITWTTDGANAGTVCYREGRFYSTNVNGVLLSERGYANRAVAEILNQEAWRHVSHVGNPKLMNNVMGQIKIVIPATIEEQQKIGRYFRTLDELISKHALQLRKLKQLKAACLERMFV